MADRDSVIRKLQRQQDPAPDAQQPAAATPKGNQPPAGMVKVTLNVRTAVWRGTETMPGVYDTATANGVTPIAVVEALLLRYLTDEKFQERINDEALKAMRARRQLSANLRAEQRRQNPDE
ncbi:MAG: hypothetical protein AB7O86_14005 [Porticoccaceae bacterium]